MKDLNQYIETGVLELFVMGLLSKEEAMEVESLAVAHPEIREEIAAIEDAQEEMARLAALHPPAQLKSKLLATIETLEAETLAAGNPPFISRHSRIQDFATWIDNPENVAPEVYDDPFFIVLSNNEDGMTGMVWIQNNIPSEVHTDVLEKLFILEGSCDVEFGGVVHSLKPGDHLDIPLHVAHTVTITSDIPCKLIVQRLVA